MRRLSTILAALALMGATVTACEPEGRADAAPKRLWREAAAQPPPPVAPPASSSLAPLIKVVKPAVVNIATTSVMKHPSIRQRRAPRGSDPWEDFFERYFGAPRELPPEEFRSNSLGSGFIINSDGFILTNNHVIQNATDIKVTLSDNREFTAKVIGKDAPLDVALLKLENAPKDLPTVPLGDSDAAQQGDFVLAMGSPLSFRESASFGIVSAKDRSLRAGPYDDFIQTDAAINPGNSGGPLFNLKGEVIGINTAIISPQIGQGIGFAVPINMAKQILPQLQAKGKVTRGYLGVAVSELTPDLARGFGLPPSTKGAVVQNVVPKTPAAKAGLQPGDVVVALNGKPVESDAQLTRTVATIPPGGKANLVVMRNGSKKELSLTVAQRPSEEALARGEGGPQEQPEEGGSAETAPAPEQKEAKLGVKLSALTPEMASELGVPGDTGVVIVDVTPGGPADNAGLQRGDLILEVNRQAVSKPTQVASIIGKMKTGEVALVRVRRGQQALFVAVKVGGGAQG